MGAGDGFEGLGVGRWLVESCHALGMMEPTVVQAAAVPACLQGRDVLASAETGSGKTAAFALPLLHRLVEDPYGVFAVILEPTRELALQVYETVHALGVRKNVRVETVTGGVDVVEQGRKLAEMPHILVATPGRLADFLRTEGVLDLSRVKFVVLDEADRLLEPCFSEDLTLFLQAANPERRQTLLFSATVSKSLERLADGFADNVFRFDAKSRSYQTVKQLVQEYYLIPEDVKDCYLVHMLLKQFNGESTVVFVATKSAAERLVWLLRELGLKCVSLHSGMKQPQRESSLLLFKNSSAKVLIATDLAARGLDVPVVSLVVNYDLPTRTSTYVHRVGRTARIGRGGVAISLVSQYDIELLQAIEAKLETKLNERQNAAHVENELVHDGLLTRVTKARRIARLAMEESRDKTAQEALLLQPKPTKSTKSTKPPSRKRKNNPTT